MFFLLFVKNPRSRQDGAFVERRDERVTHFRGMRPPTLRDLTGGWKTFAAITYAAVAVAHGLGAFLHAPELSVGAALGAVLAAAHGRIIAAYMVHECAHSSIFREPEWNNMLGVAMVWLCLSPYVDFQHCKRIHLSHHKDRGDTVSFDYRTELRSLPQPVLRAILGLEFCFVPIVECIIHLRTCLHPLGLYPLVRSGTARTREQTDDPTQTCSSHLPAMMAAQAASDKHMPHRIRRSALVGGLATLALWALLWLRGGAYALLLHAVAGGLVAHVLSMHDAFQHTYHV